MSILHPCRSVCLAFAAGSIPLLLTLSLHGQPTQATPGSARQVADALDKIVQPRFQDVTAGQFGMGRLIPVVRGHQGVGFLGNFRASTPAEAALLASADAPRRPYLMGFLHCAHVPGKAVDAPPVLTAPGLPFEGAPNPLPPSLPKPYLAALLFRTFAPAPDRNDIVARKEADAAAEAKYALIQKTATEALPALLQGKAQEKTAQGWLVVMRPVRASQDSCLSCHTGAKRGDTLGVMVYAVGSTVNKS